MWDTPVNLEGHYLDITSCRLRTDKKPLTGGHQRLFRMIVHQALFTGLISRLLNFEMYRPTSIIIAHIGTIKLSGFPQVTAWLDVMPETLKVFLLL